MSERDNGGQAFPVPGLSNLPNEQFVYPEGGMSLRDYFAAKAMQSLTKPQNSNSWDWIASEAYTAADAMLQARKL